MPEVHKVEGIYMPYLPLHAPRPHCGSATSSVLPQVEWTTRVLASPKGGGDVCDTNEFLYVALAYMSRLRLSK